MRTQVSNYLSWPPGRPTSLPGGGGGVLRQSLFLSGQTARKSEVRQVALSLLLTGYLIQDSQVTAAAAASLLSDTQRQQQHQCFTSVNSGTLHEKSSAVIGRCQRNSASHWVVLPGLIKTKKNHERSTNLWEAQRLKIS